MNQQEKEVAAATHMWRLSRFSVTSIPSLLSSAVKGKVSRVFQVAFIFSLHVSAAHRFVHSFIRLLREPFQFRSWLFVYGPRVLFHFQTSNPNSYPTQPHLVWNFWVIYQIFKVTFGIVTLAFSAPFEIEKAFQWKFLGGVVAASLRLAPCALRAGFDKSET